MSTHDWIQFIKMIEIIKKRRSIAQLLDKDVPREVLIQLLDAAAMAPNHKRTEPWRFVIFQGNGRFQLEKAMVASADAVGVRADAMVGKAFRAPAIIAVWCAVGRGKINPPVWEDHAAVCAAIQNILLKATDLGLGAIWRTGAAVEMPDIQALCSGFDSAKGDKVLGLIYVGYPAVDEAELPEKKVSLDNKVTWIL